VFGGKLEDDLVNEEKIARAVIDSVNEDKIDMIQPMKARSARLVHDPTDEEKKCCILYILLLR